MRQFELREIKLQALRAHVTKAVERGGSLTDDEIAAILTADTEQ